MPPKADSKKDPKKGVEDKKPEEVEEKQGHSVFIFPGKEGCRYEGDWVKTETGYVRHGTGKYSENGNTYEGTWVNDEMDGKGKFCFATGAVYEGEWSHNKFDGKGKYTWPDGSFYEGEWRNNRMHGVGCFQNKEGKKYHGNFYNGFGPGLSLDVNSL